MSPNHPRAGTSVRTYRIDDELYEAAAAKAKDQGETVGDVIRRALARYVEFSEGKL